MSENSKPLLSQQIRINVQKPLQYQHYFELPMQPVEESAKKLVQKGRERRKQEIDECVKREKKFRELLEKLRDGQ